MKVSGLYYMIQILELNKSRLNYFVNAADVIQDKGVAKVGINFMADDIESLDGESEPLKYIKLDFDLLFLEVDSPIKEKKSKDVSDDEVAARFKVTYEGILKMDNTEKDFSENKLRQEVIRVIEPYIRKDIRDFTGEVNIPMIPLPINFIDVR